MTPSIPPRCNCGRLAATPDEHPEAAAVGKCVGCYCIDYVAKCIHESQQKAQAQS